MLTVLGQGFTPHYKSEKVTKYFDEHKHSIIPVWLPTVSPEFMVLKECWNISKNDLLVLTYYQSFIDFRKKVTRANKTNIADTMADIHFINED
jgi:hypothetical protein